MKFLKWVLLAASAVVLLFAAALASIAATFDPNEYKAQLADLVREKTQRTLTIEGDIHLMLFPKLGVQMGRTRLSEFKSEKEFAGPDEMRASLALMPLLSRQLVVDQIQLDGLRANLVKHKDGKDNFGDLLGAEKLGAEKKDAPAKPAEPAEGQAPIKLEVDSVRISRATLSWKDEATGATYSISDFNLKTSRVAPGIPAKFDLGATIKGNEPKLDIKLLVGGILKADLEHELFSVAGLSIKLNGAAAGFTRLAAGLSGNAVADPKKQTANADLTVKLDESNIKAKFAVSDFTALRSTFDIAIDKLNVDKYLPPMKAGETVNAPAGSQPERAIDFPPVKKLDVAGSLRIDDLTASNIKAQNVRVDVMAKNGRLDVDPLTANLYQGSVKGVASIDANANRFAIKDELDDKLKSKRLARPAEPSGPRPAAGNRPDRRRRHRPNPKTSSRKN